MLWKQLEIELFEGCMPEAWLSIANSDSRVAFVDDLLLECLNGCMVFPVTDNINITLSAHVNVFVLSPVSTSLTNGFYVSSTGRWAPKWLQKKEVLFIP